MLFNRHQGTQITIFKFSRRGRWSLGIVLCHPNFGDVGSRILGAIRVANFGRDSWRRRVANFWRRRVAKFVLRLRNDILMRYSDVIMKLFDPFDGI